MGSSWIQINLIEDRPEFIIQAHGKLLLRMLREKTYQYRVLLLAQLERSQLQIVLKRKIRR